MNEIEAFLHENPELIERFMKDNENLLNEIKQKYADMLESGDLTGRFLLSRALMEIVKVTTQAGQELLRYEMMAGQGINIAAKKGSC